MGANRLASVVMLAESWLAGPTKVWRLAGVGKLKIVELINTVALC